MKKIIFLILSFWITSNVFAGVDTDRICTDERLYGRIDQQINVSYPGKIATVHSVWKDTLYSVKVNTPVLYYAANVQSSEYSHRDFTEVYSYDCQKKIPKKLFTISLKKDDSDFYTVDSFDNGVLMIVGRYSGIATGPTSSLLLYNVEKNTLLYTYKNTQAILPESEVDGFVQTKDAWYLYYSNSHFTNSASLYRIDKKSKKITQL